MKRMAISVSVWVLVLAVAIWAQKAAQTKSGSVEQELMKLETEWGDAEIKHDLAFFDRILADDFLTTDQDGTVTTKAQYLASLKSGEIMTSSAVVDQWKVRVYGDAAVVMGLTTLKGQLKGKDVSGQYQWTDTWIKHAGRWRCVAGHGSRIPQK